MNRDQNLFDSLKNLYQFGGMTIRLIFINAIIFLFIQILSVIIRLYGVEDGLLSIFLNAVFTLNTGLPEFFFMPWGLVTSIFAHFSLWHFLMNMLFLYFLLFWSCFLFLQIGTIQHNSFVKLHENLYLNMKILFQNLPIHR